MGDNEIHVKLACFIPTDNTKERLLMLAKEIEAMAEDQTQSVFLEAFSLGDFHPFVQQLGAVVSIDNDEALRGSTNG
jgi:hypothetical protein